MRLIEGEKHYKTKTSAKQYAKQLKNKGFETLIFPLQNKYCVAYSNWRKISGIA